MAWYQSVNWRFDDLMSILGTPGQGSSSVRRVQTSQMNAYTVHRSRVTQSWFGELAIGKPNPREIGLRTENATVIFGALQWSTVIYGTSCASGKFMQVWEALPQSKGARTPLVVLTLRRAARRSANCSPGNFSIGHPRYHGISVQALVQNREITPWVIPNEVFQWCVRPLFWVQDLSYVYNNWNLSMTCCSILYIATKRSGNCPDWWLVQANDSFLMHLRYWLLSYTRSVTNCMMPPKGPRMAKVSRRIRESVIVEAKGWLWNEGFDGCFLWTILRWSHEIVTDPFASLLRSGNRDQKRPSAILHSSTSFMYSINQPSSRLFQYAEEIGRSLCSRRCSTVD